MVRAYFTPRWLLGSYVKTPKTVNRTLVHTLLHCLFRHPARGAGEGARLWDLACDIHASYLIDSLKLPCLADGNEGARAAI